MTGSLLLIGRPRLVLTGRTIHIRPIGWRLLAILSASPVEGTTRAIATALIWAAGARSDLRKLIWDLKEIEKANSMELIGTDHKSIWLAPQVQCDVRELVSGQVTTGVGLLYKGPFYDVVDEGHPAWNGWVEAERERIRSIYVDRATKVVAEPSQDRATQTREARRLIEVDPANEVAARALIVDAAMSGSAGAVQLVYSRLRSVLDGIGAKPQPETVDLVTRLQGIDRARRVEGQSARDVGIPTICILPPTSDGETRAGRLAASLIIDVTIGLCRNSLLRVIAPHSAWRISQDGSTDRLVDANISYVVSAEIFQHSIRGQQIVFTLRLASDRSILWAERVDATTEKTVAAYNLLTAEILRALVQHVDQHEFKAFSLSTDPSAYGLYLAGSRSLASLDLREIRRGRQLLRRAMTQSPRFAPSASAIARSCQLEWILTARGDDDLLVQAHGYSHTAISADPYEARGYRELGFCSLYRKRFDAALDHYERAEQLNPQYADCLADYADCLLHCGQMEAALEKIGTAIDLNPLCQDTYYWTLGASLFFLERYREAISSLKLMTDQSPVQRLLAAAYALAGDQENAQRCRAETLNTHPDMTVDSWVSILPIRDLKQAEHYRAGLKQAGFN